MSALNCLIKQLRNNDPRLLEPLRCNLGSDEATEPLLRNVANLIRTNTIIQSLTLRGPKTCILSKKRWKILLEAFVYHPSMKHNHRYQHRLTKRKITKDKIVFFSRKHYFSFRPY